MSQPNFPVNMQAAIEKIMEANRTLAGLLAPGNASILQSSRGEFEPFRVDRINMLENNNVYTPFKIGPHKSILYRGVVAVSGGRDVPQNFTSNDVAYYMAGRKDADGARWMALQIGKSMEYDFPVDEGWIFVPNADRNPTFALFETSVIGYVRSYQVSSVGSANQISDGSIINPMPAVTVDTSLNSIEIVPAGANIRSVTLYHQGGSDVWLGGQWIDGAGGGPYESQPNLGVALKAGEKVNIKNTSGISGSVSSGSALVSYIIEE